MEYVNPASEQTSHRILCCECGTDIEPNPANMCVGCLRSHVDITEGIPKQATLHFCKGCERYFQPPSEWIHCALESRELLGLCLKKLKGLNRVKLIDASFVWTEPHSKRIKVKLTVNGEIFGGAVLQQVFIVEFVVSSQMCDECHRAEAKDFWRASVQLRQRAENKTTFYYLEQLILKHRAHEQTLGIKPSGEGIDFYYISESHARKMVDFLNAMLPTRYQHSKKLISHDKNSNIYNYKFTYSVEIVPLCKNCVVCLPSKLAHQLGGIAQICLVQKISKSIRLIDPVTAQMADVSSTAYWRTPFTTICTPKQLVEYVVMDLEIIYDKDKKKFAGQGPVSLKHVVCDVWLIRPSEIGVGDTIHARTHIGHLLKPGDSVLAYNIKDSNINNEYFEKLNPENIPDLIVVKKYFPEREHHRKKRIWKLKRLTEEPTPMNEETAEYNEFLDELEEDPELRQNVNVFKDKTRASTAKEYCDTNVPYITLSEMLEDLNLDDTEME